MGGRYLTDDGYNQRQLYIFKVRAFFDSSSGSCEKIWLDIFGCHTFIYESDNCITIVKDVFSDTRG